MGALAASLNGAAASADTSRLRTRAPSSRVLCTSMTRGKADPHEMPRTLGAVGLVTGSAEVDPALASLLSALETVRAGPVRALAAGHLAPHPWPSGPGQRLRGHVRRSWQRCRGPRARSWWSLRGRRGRPRAPCRRHSPPGRRQRSRTAATRMVSVDLMRAPPCRWSVRPRAGRRCPPGRPRPCGQGDGVLPAARVPCGQGDGVLPAARVPCGQGDGLVAQWRGMPGSAAAPAAARAQQPQACGAGPGEDHAEKHEDRASNAHAGSAR